MISFKANFVNYGYVKALDSNRKKRPKRVAFVELDPKSCEDCSAVRSAVGKWGINAPIARHIRNDMERCADEYVEYDKRFFALTLQNHSFLSLEPSNILGLVQISKDTFDENGVDIDFLQTRPDCCGSHRQKKLIYDIGRRILESLENVVKGFNIYVASAPSAVGFYEKCGYEIYSLLAGTDLVKRANKVIKP